MSNPRSGFIAPLLLALIAFLLLGGGAYVYEQNKPVNQSVVVTPSTQAILTTQTPSTFDVADLGVTFSLPSTIADLTYKVVKLSGDQAVNSVAFSSKQLEAAGCGLDTAPLGYLTYNNNKGGSVVGRARGSDLYYIKPNSQCKADVSLQNWQELEIALQSLVTDAPETTMPQASFQTTDWKTYSSAQFNFSFKYPPDWGFSGELGTDSSPYMPPYVFGSLLQKGVATIHIDVLDMSMDAFLKVLAQNPTMLKSATDFSSTGFSGKKFIRDAPSHVYLLDLSGKIIKIEPSLLSDKQSTDELEALDSVSQMVAETFSTGVL